MIKMRMVTRMIIKIMMMIVTNMMMIIMMNVMIHTRKMVMKIS